MKTWWNFLPALLLVFLIPFIAGALPTLEIKGQYWGGGVVREFAINHVAQWLPHGKGQQYVAAFSQASLIREYVLYLPIALNVATVLFAVMACFYSMFITTSNWIDRKVYQSQRKASKGA